MAPVSAIDYTALTAAICDGVSRGNIALIEKLVRRSDSNHELRGVVEANTAKVYNLDTEVKLIKGHIMSLTGQGDGSTGAVPNMQREIRAMSGDMDALKAQVGMVQNDVAAMSRKLDQVLGQNVTQKAWTDGWKGVGVAIGIMGTCLTVIGSLIGGLVWLFTHTIT